MKEYKKTNDKKSNAALSKLGFRIMAVLTGVLIAAVGILCTSPSKAADEAPYYSSETEPETDEVTTAPEPVTQTEAETLIPFDTAGVTFYYTDTENTDVTEDNETTDEAKNAEMTAEMTTAGTTTAEVTEPPVTEKPEPPEGKQEFREYNGREYGANETFVGEYATDRVSVGVSHVEYGDISYFICDIKVSSAKDLHTAFANPNNITSTAYTSRIAASVGAGFAVNGDYCGFRYGGIIIREGGLYRNKKSNSSWDLCYMNKYGDLVTCSNDNEDGKALVDGGAWQSWCFGPTLVSDYKALQKFNTPDLSSADWAREPRTAIGQIDDLHYIILVVDAVRDLTVGGWNTIGGMNFRELADTFEALGCKTAYNLDGGASTALWLNGKIINKPAGVGNGERAVSDIIYLK